MRKKVISSPSVREDRARGLVCHKHCSCRSVDGGRPTVGLVSAKYEDEKRDRWFRRNGRIGRVVVRLPQTSGLRSEITSLCVEPAMLCSARPAKFGSRRLRFLLPLRCAHSESNVSKMLNIVYCFTKLRKTLQNRIAPSYSEIHKRLWQYEFSHRLVTDRI